MKLAILGIFVCLRILASVSCARAAQAQTGGSDSELLSILTKLDEASQSADSIKRILSTALTYIPDLESRDEVRAAFAFHAAANLMAFSVQTNQEAIRPYEMLVEKQRSHLGALTLWDRVRLLRESTLPLDRTYSVNEKKLGQQSVEEIDVLMSTWHALLEEANKIGEARHQAVAANIPPPGIQGDIFATARYEAELARNEEARSNNEKLNRLRIEGQSLTNKIASQIVKTVSLDPARLPWLQEKLDGYLPPTISTNVVNKVFAAMKPEVAAKTPRPVPGAKGERWLRTEAPAPRPEPGLPAIAKPSRIREGISNRSSQAAAASATSGAAAGAEPASSGAEHPGGRPVWPWAVLGVGVFAWAWWKLRS
ncbi:MAG: hypothetical protein FD161_3124 [Limisphaerales bacterium]|nr:MAG: hypothetical protein FD161_3124 [Limisphaerales bacterium]KAG0508033.1 MAG: hypothetical protein E1N63_2831 [Limisphaerales bacterium]TXT50432.1 MAG: hypothetical protein FD140_2355 [Limisphaerales bacterium]